MYYEWTPLHKKAWYIEREEELCGEKGDYLLKKLNYNIEN